MIPYVRQNQSKDHMFIMVPPVTQSDGRVWIEQRINEDNSETLPVGPITRIRPYPPAGYVGTGVLSVGH